MISCIVGQLVHLAGDVVKRSIALVLFLAIFLLGTGSFAQGAFRIKRADQAEDGAQGFARTVVRTRGQPESMIDSEIFKQKVEDNWTNTFSQPPPAQAPAEPRFPEIPVITRLLSPNELSRLNQRDIVIVIDKSGSMSERDCPGDRGSLQRMLPGLITGRSFFDNPGTISRWEWCARQTFDLARQTSRLARQSLSVVLFDSRDRVYENASLRSIPMIFQNNRPQGGTNMLGALKRQLNNYFDRRSASRVKPLLVAVITDGAPDSPSRIRDLIAETTMRMQSPDEIIITFLQVGNDREGHQFLQELDQGVRMNNAVYDIVHTHSFPQLMREGLASSLVRAVSSTRQAYR